MSNRLTGNTIFSGAQGTAANQPPNWSFEQRPPTPYDTIAYSVGDLWMDESALPEPEAWILVSLQGNGSIPGELAHWIRFTGNAGTVTGLSGDIGGFVPPDDGGNINVITNNAARNAGSTVLISGNPATNTLTLDVTDAAANTIIGINSGNLTPGTASQCVGLGANVLQNITGLAAHDVAIGNLAMQLLTTGRGNTAVGHGNLGLLTTGNDNVAVGYNSLAGIVTGSENVAVGNGSMTNSLAATTGNTAIGDDALITITGGNYNTALGWSAGASLTTTDSNNLLINHAGIVGDNNICRIGGATGGGTLQLQKVFFAGIRGITTDANDAIAVLISSTGQLGTVSSSIRFKENIKDMAQDSDAIFNLRPVTFSYKKDENKAKQYGLIAEEVAEVFPRLAVYDKEGQVDTVKYQDLPVLLLNELQKQRKTIEALSLSVRHLENLLQSKKDCNC